MRRDLIRANLESAVMPHSAFSTLCLALLVLQNTTLVLLLKYTFREGATAYNPSTVVFTTEALKLLISATMCAIQSRVLLLETVRQIRKQRLLFIPSILYVLQNNLLFHGAKRLTPIVYIVCTQTKVMTTAIMSRVILGTTLTNTQYALLALLILGIILVQGQGHMNESRNSTTDIFHANSSDGVLAVLFASWISGTAGVVLEKILKSESAVYNTALAHNIWTRNLQLSFISLPFAACGMLFQNNGNISGDFFTGFDEVVFGVIILQASGGFIISYVLKFADNILKCLAVAVSICCCAVYSVLVHELILTASLVVGVFIVNAAVCAFGLSDSFRTRECKPDMGFRNRTLCDANRRDNPSPC